MTSKLEAALANDLHLMSSKADAPWPEAVAQFHPWWCCQHLATAHRYRRGVRRICMECDAPDDWHEYAHESRHSVDFAYPAFKVAIECEGVNWGVQGGRHQTGAGFSKDLEKYAALELAGWRVIRCGAAQIKDGTALSLIEAALGATK